VDVWHADLNTVDHDLLSTLSAAERSHPAEYRRRSAGLRWARSRGLLRVIIGLYLDTDPALVRFSVTPDGKPCLREPAERGTPGLAFNLSHSGDLAVYALSTAGPVGVDVELVRGRQPNAAVAVSVFGHAEAGRLLALDPADRDREFLRAWVRHEAAVKCLGTGLRGVSRALARTRTTDVVLGSTAVAAVATLNTPARLRCQAWPGSDA
jgi:4'-phosphopantetheinyl transferase